MANYVLGNEAGEVISCAYGMDRAPYTDITVVAKIAHVADGGVQDAQRLILAGGLALATEALTVTTAAECAMFADLGDYDPDGLVTGRPLEFPRRKRNALLAASDLWGAADYRVTKSAAQQAAWDAYRQALRDLPESNVSNWAVVWPAEPAV